MAVDKKYVSEKLTTTPPKATPNAPVLNTPDSTPTQIVIDFLKKYQHVIELCIVKEGSNPRHAEDPKTIWSFLQKQPDFSDFVAASQMVDQLAQKAENNAKIKTLGEYNTSHSFPPTPLVPSAPPVPSIQHGPQVSFSSEMTGSRAGLRSTSNRSVAASSNLQTCRGVNVNLGKRP